MLNYSVAELRLNKKEYSYTLYSAVQSSTSWIKLRPREYLLSIQYQW